MKIIKPGKPFGALKFYKVTCRYCECVFEFSELEGKRIPDSRDGDYFEVSCPECHNTVTKAAKP